MKRFVVGLCLFAALFAPIHSIDAAQRQLPQRRNPQLPVARNSLGTVTDATGRVIGQVVLPNVGSTALVTLPSGHRFSINMVNGRAVGAQVVDPSGAPVPAEVRNQGTVVHKTIVIIIRSGGTTIVVIVRT